MLCGICRRLQKGCNGADAFELKMVQTQDLFFIGKVMCIADKRAASHDDAQNDSDMQSKSGTL